MSLLGIMKVRELEQAEKERKGRGRKNSTEERSYLMSSKSKVHCRQVIPYLSKAIGKGSHRLSDYYFAFLEKSKSPKNS